MPTLSSTGDERPYHHGDLPRAIVAAALEILSETQSHEFSLRELARRAGVSHNAPYKHFADKRDLLAAVSATGFEALTKRMTIQAAKASNPRAALMAVLRAYIQYGVDNPALYKLMFGGYLGGRMRTAPRSSERRPSRPEPCSPVSSATALSDRRSRICRETNAKLRGQSWLAGRSSTASHN